MALDEIAQKKFIAPMLATLIDEPFNDPKWIFEEKFDGVRCIANISKQHVQLYSRNRKSLNVTFPEIVTALKNMHLPSCILDGEIVVFERGISRFQLIQNRLNLLDLKQMRGKPAKVIYCVFDLLTLRGKRMTHLPLSERKKELKKWIHGSKLIRYTPHKKGQGIAFFKVAERKGWEGMLAKKSDSAYVSRRSRDWLKCKCVKRQEFVIGGYTQPQGARIGFGALLIGYYAKGKLHFAGKVGTGYDDALLASLGKKLHALRTQRSPFIEPIRGAYFVRPTLVCEVEFTEWTRDGKLRHPAFIGLRKDKRAQSVRREESS